MKLLHQPPAVYESTKTKVAIVTGLSDPQSTNLHHSQLEFLESLPIGDASIVKRNFPFVETDQPAKHSGLAVASFHNVSQFLACRRRKNQALARPHWHALLESTEDLFLIVGSCGLEIVNQIPVQCSERKRIELLALGPVNLCQSRFAVTTIRGKRDWISWLFNRRVDHALPGLGHMGYWCDEAVKGITQNWLLDRTSGLSEPAVTCPADD